VHTFFCPEDNTEDTVALLWMEGAQINFDEDGKLVSINDATAIQFITEKVSVEQGTGPVNYIHGGAAAAVANS
jgi:2,4'-dihydroxyacetophenone dioxygenase